MLFQKQLVKRPEYRKLVRQFNEVCNEIPKTSSCFIVQLGTDLMKFELEVEREQKNPKIRRVEKMLAQPILKMKEESNQLIVNLDPRLVMMLRENERLCKLDIAMPRYMIAFFRTPLLCSRQRATVPGEKEGLVPQLSGRGRANVGHLHLHHDIPCS